MTSALLLTNFAVTGHCRQNHNGITEYSGLKGSFRGPAAHHCESSANQVGLSSPGHLPQWRSHSLGTKSCNFSRDFVKELFDKERHHTQCAVLCDEQLKGTYLLGPLPEGVCPPLLCGNVRPEEPTAWGFSPRISF